LITGKTIENVYADYKCLIHLDRLSLTFRLWSGSTFQDIRNPDFISQERIYNEITITHDPSPGLGAYYHSYRVFFKGHLGGTIVHVMHNGTSFVIAGTENEIAIYNKSRFAEDFIHDYFSNNGLATCDVHRIESRLTWNYIRYLRNKKGLDTNIETLLDQGKLANIYKISTINKITFKDTSISTIDYNRNKKFQTRSIIDDLDIDTVEIGKLNTGLQASHYKTKSIDEDIMRQNYFMFLESGNKKYFKNFKSSSSVAGYNRSQTINFVHRLNSKYNGNRTHEIQKRMGYAVRSIAGSVTDKLSRLFHSMIIELKSIMLEVF
jgi:hypothetical protein